MIGRLEMLIALARERHFGRAAESLGITQPSLSAGIKQLEEHLGVKLVQRGSRYGGLTPEGQRTLAWARKIVGDSRSLRAEMRASQEGLAGELKIAVIPTALTWASRLAHAFSAAHPNVTFTLLSRTSAEILSMLENLEIDAGMTYLDNEPLGRVAVERIYRENYSLICAEDHPLAGRERLDWAELGHLPLCLLTPDMQNRRIINRAFLDAGVVPQVTTTSNSTVVLINHVSLGGYATILPRDLGIFLAKGHALAQIPIGTQDMGPAVGLVAAYQDPQTPVLKALFGQARTLAGGS